MSLSATCKVSIAFADGPLVASPAWTDVTAYVRSVRTNRGRSNELDDFQAGTATIVLENTDRRFDPDYASGAYYPNVKVRRQIKVEGVYSATTYPVFRGVVQSWGQDWPVHNRDATCTVQAVDLFGLLATWDLPESAYETVVRSLNPTSWFDVGSTEPADLIGQSTVSYGGLRTEAAALAVGSTGASRHVIDPYDDNVTVSSVASFGFSPNSSNKTTLAAFVKVSDLLESYDGVVAFDVSLLAVGVRHNSGTGVCRVGVASTGQFVGYVSTSGGSAQVGGTSGETLVDGYRHYLAMVRDGTGLTLYLDGVSFATAVTGSTSFTVLDGTIGSGPSGLSISSVRRRHDFIIDEPTVWHGVALTAAQLLSLSDTRDGWAAETASARIVRVLDLLTVPSGLYSTTTASSSVGAFVGGSNALSYLQSVARSDQGRLFVDRSGVITFQPKTADMGGSASVTFADDTTASSVRYSGFGLEYDDRLIYNDVVIAGVNCEAKKENLTSIAAYSQRSLSLRTQLPTTAAARDVAEATVARYADPSTRGKGWKAHPQRALNGVSTLGYATVLGRELGDLVSIKRTPPVGTAITQTVSVTSIGHDINIPEGKWDVSFTGAPAYTTASFRWGTSNWGGTDYWS